MAAFGVDGHHNALGAVLGRGVSYHLRVGQRGRVEAGFVGARVEQAAHIVHRAHTTAHRERNEHLVGHGFDDVQNHVAPIAGGGNVQKGQFVGALFVVTRGNFHRVAGVTQRHEVDPFDDASARHVQARDDAFG